MAKIGSADLPREGKTDFPNPRRLHRQQPRGALQRSTALAVFRWHDAFRIGARFVSRIPQLGGFSPRGSHRHEHPPTDTPPADFCSTTRPADTSAALRSPDPIMGPSGKDPKTPTGREHQREEPPKVALPRASRTRTPVVAQPSLAKLGIPHEKKRLGRGPVSNALREEERLSRDQVPSTTNHPVRRIRRAAPVLT